MLARIRSNAFDEAVTAFVLSTHGRAWLTRDVNGGDLIERLINPNEDPFEPIQCRELSVECVGDMTAESTQSTERDITLDDIALDTVEVENTEEQTEEQRQHTEEEEDERAEPTATRYRRSLFKSTLAELSDVPPLWKLSPEFIANYMQIAAETMSKLTGITAEQCEIQITAWLAGDIGLGHVLDGVQSIYETDQRLHMDVQFWKQLHFLAQHDHRYREWGEFASVACVLENAACSEAAVERLLSIQKHLQGTTMTNVGMDVLTAKLQMYGPGVVAPAGVHDVTPQ